MLSVTEAAQNIVRDTLAEEKMEAPVRIFLNEDGGCGGPQLAITVSQTKDDDSVFELEGQTYLLNENLYELCGDVEVDYVDDGIRKGFIITSEKEFAQHGGCGSCCGC
jgi:Fe-S cluster assembly iron-binding protein IscA